MRARANRSAAYGFELGLFLDTTLSGDVPDHSRRHMVANTTLPMASRDRSSVVLRLLVDRSVIELYAQEGRRVISATAYPKAASTAARTFVRPAAAPALALAPPLLGVRLAAADSWEMGCGWVESL